MICVVVVNAGFVADTAEINGTQQRVFTLGYITGSRRRPGDREYPRPGLTISGAISLALAELNAPALGGKYFLLYSKERLIYFHLLIKYSVACPIDGQIPQSPKQIFPFVPKYHAYTTFSMN